MLDNIAISTFLNICMLVALAVIMTRMDFVKRIILNREVTGEDPGQARRRDLMNRVPLGIMMGLFCIASNTIGFVTPSAIPNARVIGAMSAGMLGGPISGIIASVMGAVHRYLGNPARISTPGCVTATLLQGLAGSFLWYLRKRRVDYRPLILYTATMVMEILHMVLIYVMAGPRDEAMDIIRIIAPSMVLINPLGMVLVFDILLETFRQADRRVAVRVSDSLGIAERCIPYLKSRGLEREDAGEVIRIIMEESEYAGVAIFRGNEALALSPGFRGQLLPEEEGDIFRNLRRQHMVYMAEVEAGGEPKMRLVLLGKRNDYSYRADQAFAEGLASLFTTYIKLAELEEQREMRRKAELQALQSQINPHFLFNSLNTISFFCREKPEKARELLLALSTYFRNSLQEADTMIPLEQEMAHVEAYLMLEKARFEERLQVELRTEPEAMAAPVPNLILQPLVENAVRHGARTRKIGRVEVEIRREGQQVTVEVLDNGPGVPEAVEASLRGGEKVQKGIGLLNVHRRLVGVYGETAGLQISRQGEMTRIRFVIPERGGEG